MSVIPVSSLNNRSGISPSADSPEESIRVVRVPGESIRVLDLLEIKMSVSPVSSLNNRSEISPSADSPEGSLRVVRVPEESIRVSERVSDLTVAELVKDKIFKVVYYIPLIGRITQNYFEEKEAKINYYKSLHLVKMCYRAFIVYVKNSDAESTAVCAGFVKNFVEKFAEIAAAIPKDDKKFAQKVDLDVGAAWAIAATTQQAVDKEQQLKINYSNTLYFVEACYRRAIEYVENSDAEKATNAEKATICARFAKNSAEKFAQIAAAIPKNDEKFAAEKVDLDVKGARALATAAQEAVDKMKEKRLIRQVPGHYKHFF